MTKPKPKDIDPHSALLKDFTDTYKNNGGRSWLRQWSKNNRTLFLQLYAKLMAQPQVVNNVNVANVRLGEESARRQLELAFLRLIEARRASVGDPAAYHGGERVDDNLIIEHQPRLSDDARPATDDAAVSPLDESSKSPMKGPLNARGGVLTTPGATNPTGGTKQKTLNSFPSIPGQAAGVALDQSADANLSASEKSLLCFGGGRRWP
jgi:hypothetical protein